jgi:hypothetical protein
MSFTKVDWGMVGFSEALGANASGSVISAFWEHEQDPCNDGRAR